MASARKLRREVKRLVFKNYDLIYSTSQLFCRKFSVKRIPLITIDRMIDLSELKEVSHNQTFELLRVNFNKTLTQLKIEIRKNSAIVGDDKISLSEIKAMIDILKEGFIKGQNQGLDG